jgi:hypothetical protein
LKVILFGATGMVGQGKRVLESRDIRALGAARP